MPLENIFLIFFFLFVLKVLVCRDQLLHLAAIAMCELMLGELQAAGVPVATADREKCSEGKEVLALVGEPRQNGTVPRGAFQHSRLKADLGQ